MSALLEIEHLFAGHHGFDVLHDVSLLVPEGELTVLVGPNGAGKTTLLSALAGVIPGRGAVRFAGAAVLGESPSRLVVRGLSLVPEGRHLFPHMSVRENLELGAYLAPRGERGARLARVLRVFPALAARQGQLVGTMSGGEQQMVAVARGLMSKPRLLLLDEPSLGLAPKLVGELFRVVKRVCSEGTSVLLVEQNVRQALTLADRAYVLERGRVAAEGSGQELLASERIRRAYLGTM